MFNLKTTSTGTAYRLKLKTAKYVGKPCVMMRSNKISVQSIRSIMKTRFENTKEILSFAFNVEILAIEGF